jgi:hypothetical protein
MADALMIMCLVLAGPIAISATESATDGDLIELPQGDFEQLARWGIVREATEAEQASHKGISVAPVEPEPEPAKETAAQRRKREAEEAKAAQEAEEPVAQQTEEPAV